MANMININSDELVKFTAKLEKLGRADLPIAVRGTLTELAFRMKGTSGKRGQIELQAKNEFDYIRNKTLFRAMTGVTKAKGLKMSSMVSESGIIKRSGKDQVAEGLAQQQEGGKTKSKTTPLNPSRIGKNLSKKVRRTSYNRTLGKPIEATNARGKRFIKLALRAYNSGRGLAMTSRRGTSFIVKVRGFTRQRGKIKFRLDWLYRINKGGTVDLSKKRPFVNNAAKVVLKQLPRIFEDQANKRIKKAWEKK